MTCEYCGGQVEWQGKVTNLTFTLCLDCGAKNCQIEEDTEKEEL